MSPIDPKVDATLVQSILAGNRKDFGRLVERYYDAAQAYARGRTRDDSAAQDATQEAFLSALQRLHQLRSPQKFGPWLFSIVRNECNTAAGKDKRQLRSVDVPNSVAEPDVEGREVRAIVRCEIEKLPEIARDVLSLHYLAGLDLPDVARLLDISHAAARKRLQRAREALGEKLLSALSYEPAETSQRDRRKQHVSALALALPVNWNVAAATTTHTLAGIALTGGTLAVNKLAAVVLAIAVTGFVVYQISDESEIEPEIDVASNQASPDLIETPSEVAPEESVVLAVEEAAESTQGNVLDTAPAIVGRVLDHFDLPVEGAEVHLWRYMINGPGATRDDIDMLVATTDAEGAFRFEIMEAAPRLSLSPKKEGLFRRIDEGFVAEPYDGNPIETVLRLYPGGIINGRVVSPDGRPIPEKDVTALARDVEFIEWETTTTDALGRFELTDLIPAVYNVSVIPEDQATSSIEDAVVEVGPAQTIDDIEIVYEGDDLVYAGKVVDEYGSPISKVFVQLYGVFANSPTDTYTDTDGRFRLVRLPAGRYSTMIGHPGYDGAGRVVAEAGDQDVEIVLKRARLTSVAFRLIDAETREPLTRADVYLKRGRNESFDTMQYGVFRSEALTDGRYRHNLVTWDHLTAIFRAKGYLFAYQYADLSNGSRREFTVEMQPSPLAEGIVVTADGEPVQDAYLLTGPYPRVALERPGWDTDSMKNYWLRSATSGQTGADGTFTVDTLDRSMTVLTAIHLKHGIGAIPFEFDSIDQQDLRIVISNGATLEGTVTLDGAAVEGADIRLYGDESGLGTQPLTKTDASGRYRIDRLFPGRYRVVTRIPQKGASLDSFAGRNLKDTIDLADNRTQTLDFSFEAAAADMEGFVTVGGEAAAAGTIYLSVDTPTGVQQFVKRIDSDGTYTITGIPPGAAHLVAYAGVDASNQASGEPMEFSIQSEPLIRLDIDIRGGRAIQFNLAGLYEDENKIRVTAIEGIYEPGDRVAPFGDYIVAATTHTDSRGSVELRGLRPGIYTIRAYTTIVSEEHSIRTSRNQSFVIQVPDDGETSPILVDVSF